MIFRPTYNQRQRIKEIKNLRLHAYEIKRSQFLRSERKSLLSEHDARPYAVSGWTPGIFRVYS